jgi:hypothetical protein
MTFQPPIAQCLLALLALFTSALGGCASYRNVRVLVVNNRTKMPLEGVTITTKYSPKPFSLALRKQASAVTDPTGVAVLRANYLQYEPTLFGISGEFRPAYCVAQSLTTTMVFPSSGALLRSLAGRTLHTYDITFPISDQRFIKLPRNVRARAHANSGNNRIEACRQRCWLAQLWKDVGEAWTFLTSPFREPIDSGGMEK